MSQLTDEQIKLIEKIFRRNYRPQIDAFVNDSGHWISSGYFEKLIAAIEAPKDVRIAELAEDNQKYLSALKVLLDSLYFNVSSISAHLGLKQTSHITTDKHYQHILSVVADLLCFIEKQLPEGEASVVYQVADHADIFSEMLSIWPALDGEYMKQFTIEQDKMIQDAVLECFSNGRVPTENEVIDEIKRKLNAVQQAAINESRKLNIESEEQTK